MSHKIIPHYNVNVILSICQPLPQRFFPCISLINSAKIYKTGINVANINTEEKVMNNGPPEVFDPDDDSDDFSKRPIIDITPGLEQEETGEAKTDGHLLDESLKKQKLDRSDKTQVETQEIHSQKTIVVILLLVIIIALLFIFR